MNDVNNETNPLGLPDYRQALRPFLKEAKTNDSLYKINIANGFSPDTAESQVCLQVDYKSAAVKPTGDDAVQALFIPRISEVSILINAPPMIPYDLNESMPQDLWEVVKSDDPSRVPSVGKMKCVEIAIETKNTYASGSTSAVNDIYRIDFTRGKPVVYKRVVLPKNKQQRRDVLGDTPELVAALDTLQPFAHFEYVKVDRPGEFERIIDIVSDCKRKQEQGQRELIYIER